MRQMVVDVKLQGLHHELEIIQMKEGEPVADFLSKVMTIVTQERTYGEPITDQMVVEKVIRSLPERWDHVVAAIKESKDLSILSYDQLMGSLQSHESKVNRGLQVPVEEQVFQASDVKIPPVKEEENTVLFARGRGRISSRSRGRERGFGRGKNNIQFFNGNRFGNVKADCWSEPQVSTYIGDDDDEGQFFMAVTCSEDCKNMNMMKTVDGFMATKDRNDTTQGVWFLDSGCSNHMTGYRSMFNDIDHKKWYMYVWGMATRFR
jgi:hypothetical protein